MPQINTFGKINDYISTLDLNVEIRHSDFLVFDYEHANWEHYDRLSTYRQDYFEISLDITKGCNSFVDQFELPTITNRLTLISPHRLQTAGSHEEMKSELYHQTVAAGHGNDGLTSVIEVLKEQK